MDLIDQIDEALITEERREKTAHYPSEASACIRQVYFKWQGHAPSDPIEPTSLWKMRIGDAIHGFIPDLLRKLGYEVEEEKPVLYEHPRLTKPVSGRLDILIRKDGNPWLARNRVSSC